MRVYLCLWCMLWGECVCVCVLERERETERKLRTKWEGKCDSRQPEQDTGFSHLSPEQETEQTRSRVKLCSLKYLPKWPTTSSSILKVLSSPLAQTEVPSVL